MASINVLEQKDKEVKFILDKASPGVANALRRACQFEVPVMAIEDVYFLKNSSALYDEIIAHRLGLVPFVTDLKGYELPRKCSCKGRGCAKCQVKMTLRAKGPCTVYAKDIKVKDPSIKAVYPDIPIVKLLENQELELEAVACLGQGKEHAKWSAGHASYQGYPEIEISQKDLKKSEDIASHCPRNVFEVKGDRLAVANLEACNLCKDCEDRSEGAVKVSGSEKKFIFSLESWGQLTPAHILNEAVDMVQEKLKEVKL